MEKQFNNIIQLTGMIVILGATVAANEVETSVVTSGSKASRSCKDDRTAETDRLLLVVSMKTGFSYRRWQQGIDFCIPKKVDSIKVTKLRTITFLECDFNQLNKIVARRLMKHAENSATLAIEQIRQPQTQKCDPPCC